MTAALVLAAAATTAAPVKQDKILHASLSALMTAGSIKMQQAVDDDHLITTENRVISSLLALAIGYAKESLDAHRRGRPFDGADFAADGAGVVVGNFLQWEF